MPKLMPEEHRYTDPSCARCRACRGLKEPSPPLLPCPDCWYRYWWWQSQGGNYRIQQLLVDFGFCLMFEGVCGAWETEEQSGPPPIPRPPIPKPTHPSL